MSTFLTYERRKLYAESIQVMIEELLSDDLLKYLNEIDETVRLDVLGHGSKIEKFEQQAENAYLVVDCSSYVRLGTYYYLKNDYDCLFYSFPDFQK